MVASFAPGASPQEKDWENTEASDTGTKNTLAEFVHKIFLLL